MRGPTRAKSTEHDAHEGGSQHDSADTDQARLHGGLAQLQLVWAPPGRRVLNRPPHECEDANRNRDIADARGQTGEQRVDVAVH